MTNDMTETEKAALEDIERAKANLYKEPVFQVENYLNGIILPLEENYTIKINRGYDEAAKEVGAFVMLMLNTYLMDGGWPRKIYGKAIEAQDDEGVNTYYIELSLTPFEDKNDYPDLFLFSAFDPSKVESWNHKDTEKNMRHLTLNFLQGVADAGG